MLKNIVHMLLGVVLVIINISAFADDTVAAQSLLPNSQFTLPPPGDDLIGEIIKIKTQQTASLATLAQQYDLGALEMFAANPNRTRELFNAGNTVILPKQYILPPVQYRNGIVINVSELRLYYFLPNGAVETFPVALGREGWSTPLAETKVYRKQANPTWYVPESIRAATLAQTGEELPTMVSPGPNNPLGPFALYLGLNGYLIHGNNNPSSIGRLVSSGCIRLYNSDIEQLFYAIAPGTPVHIINYPIKAGWLGNQLYLEVHQPIKDVDGNYENATPSLQTVIVKATAGKNVIIDWKKVNKIVEKHTGIPTVIGELNTTY